MHRTIKERVEKVCKKIGDKLTPEIKASLNSAESLDEVEEIVSIHIYCAKIG